ncbi:5126_t:CDS:1 [Ambispora gerdemannii]|uniref:5126_t:CDS:1 n=1 Tax=Ambispora gerdemannii TaxID=144530 RepID=A0A9N8ZZ20_9GLOM|nr:5126_t:CDS:1 [Ambispora gerdemannii]
MTAFKQLFVAALTLTIFASSDASPIFDVNAIQAGNKCSIKQTAYGGPAYSTAIGGTGVYNTGFNFGNGWGGDAFSKARGGDAKNEAQCCFVNGNWVWIIGSKCDN